jgi:upstream activation factor subunit UAF30
MAKTAKKKAAPKKTAPKKKAASKPVKKAAAKPVKKAAAPKKKAARKPNAAFMRPVTPSSTLAEIVGAKPMPRTEVTKKLWLYIKKNNLQDQANRRQINADAKLKAVFGGKSSVNMFAMTKLVSNHLS